VKLVNIFLPPTFNNNYHVCSVLRPPAEKMAPTTTIETITITRPLKVCTWLKVSDWLTDFSTFTGDCIYLRRHRGGFDDHGPSIHRLAYGLRLAARSLCALHRGRFGGAAAFQHPGSARLLLDPRCGYV